MNLRPIRDAIILSRTCLSPMETTRKSPRPRASPKRHSTNLENHLGNHPLEAPYSLVLRGPWAPSGSTQQIRDALFRTFRVPSDGWHPIQDAPFGSVRCPDGPGNSSGELLKGALPRDFGSTGWDARNPGMLRCMGCYKKSRAVWDYSIANSPKRPQIILKMPWKAALRRLP